MSEVEQWITKAREIEIHKGGNAQGLIDWYNNGANGQINWGEHGDFDACVAIAGKYLDNPEGFCQRRHMDATGEPAGNAPGEVSKSESLTPPKGVQEAAQKALEWMKDGKAGDGFTSVGRKRASDLANGHPVSMDTLKRMKAYFDRHQADKDSPHWNEPSPGKVAWCAWGGDAGYSWAKSAVGEIEKAAPQTLYTHTAHEYGTTGTITYDGAFSCTGEGQSFVDILRLRAVRMDTPRDDASIWKILSNGITIGDEYVSWSA